ncbi:hypothetical protein CC79DRAFT_818880 [Sarocladium strictum]
MPPEAKRKRRDRSETPPAEGSDKKTQIDFSKGTIEVVVGATDPVTFHVQEELIRRNSGYFRSIFSGQWVESSNRKVRLAWHEADIFNFYLNWVYRRDLDKPIVVSEEAIMLRYLELAKAYALGDYLQDFTFKNAVIDAFSSIMNGTSGYPRSYPNAIVVYEVYTNTTEHSGLRNLLVHIYAQSETNLGKWFVEERKSDDFPQGFLYDLAASLLKKGARSALCLIDSRKFHDVCPIKGATADG